MFNNPNIHIWGMLGFSVLSGNYKKIGMVILKNRKVRKMSNYIKINCRLMS